MAIQWAATDGCRATGGHPRATAGNRGQPGSGTPGTGRRSLLARPVPGQPVPETSCSYPVRAVLAPTGPSAHGWRTRVTTPTPSPTGPGSGPGLGDAGGDRAADDPGGRAAGGPGQRQQDREVARRAARHQGLRRLLRGVRGAGGPSAAATIADWDQRGKAVVEALKRTADASQSDVRKQLTLAEHGIPSVLGREHDPGPRRQRGAGPHPGGARQRHAAALAGDVRAAEARSGQGREDDRRRRVGHRPDQAPTRCGRPSACAARASSSANIDTGVDFDHPALVGKYRGNTRRHVRPQLQLVRPVQRLRTPSLAPCDNNDHGTHTMGTMVGDDGAGNQIGVAPGARWIAAKGCETNSCSDAALLASGQWILAPTDLGRRRTRGPTCARTSSTTPGAARGGDTWYQRPRCNAWRAAGIFPAFSNGNAGPACGTVRLAGRLRGVLRVRRVRHQQRDRRRSPAAAPASGGAIKPNLAAPGVNVRSSIPGGGYGRFSGTSMASPHTAGTVALMWSAAPSLIGDIGPDRGAAERRPRSTPSDLTCGGTAANNNVWGEGKLDAFAAVDQSPRGPVGTLSGTVTDAEHRRAARRRPGRPSPARSTGPRPPEPTAPTSSPCRSATTRSRRRRSAIGTSTADRDGHRGRDDHAGLRADPGAERHASAARCPSAAGPVANATVTIAGTPIAPATTDADGRYAFAACRTARTR